MQLSQPTQNIPVLDESKETPEVSSAIMNLFSHETDHTKKISAQMYQTIVQIQSTRKLYHIRQNFRRLALTTLQLQNAEFYVFHDSGRIEFHDFKENYITQVLEQNDKKRTIQHLLANSSSTVQNFELRLCKQQKILQGENIHESNKKFEQLSKLFGARHESRRYVGQINKENEKYSILSLFTYPQSSSATIISSKIIQKLIIVSMIEIDQQTEYDIVQFYSKELLDILGLIVGESEQKMKRVLTEVASNKISLTGQELLDISLNELIKRCFSTEQYEYLMSESMNYQEYRYELLERIRMHSKHLCQDNTIFMDFDGSGYMTFLSNNRKNSEFQPTLAKLSLTQQLSIQKIFSSNMTLQQHIRKSLEGHCKNKKLYEIQRGIKARVSRNQENEIQRIIILVQEPIVVSSSSSLSSSTVEGMSSKKKKGSSSDSISLGKSKAHSGSLIGNIERENPGISENGWLNLFIKETDLKRKNSSTMAKKKATHFAKGQDDQTSSTSLKQLISEDLAEQLKNVDIFSPDTNLLELQSDILEPFVKKVFFELKYFKSLDCNKEFFDNFLFHLNEGYSIHDNPFHNFMHGVNVMHTCFLICTIPGNEQILSPLKVFSTVLSGLCHDVGHTGRTNSFEIASRSKKALTYNDLSPLQNFHASFAFEILRRPENNFLEKLSLEDFNQIRKDIISNILYTDIKEHFPLIKKFKTIDFSPQPGKVMNPEDVRTLTGMITHTSDFGGSAKQFEICREWSRRVNIEFSSQYRQQEMLGLPQTPFFKDLDVEPIMAKNEMGFLKVIVFPLYEVLQDFYKDDGCLLKLKNYAQQNIKEWEKVHLNSVATNKEEVKN